MTKEANSKDTAERAGSEPGGRRRRRRRGGLRVPSDNVPRRARARSENGEAQAEIAAPVPEDPKYAVSVAMAFTESGRAVVPRASSEPAPAMEPKAEAIAEVEAPSAEDEASPSDAGAEGLSDPGPADADAVAGAEESPDGQQQVEPEMLVGAETAGDNEAEESAEAELLADAEELDPEVAADAEASADEAEADVRADAEALDAEGLADAEALDAEALADAEALDAETARDLRAQIEFSPASGEAEDLEDPGPIPADASFDGGEPKVVFDDGGDAEVTMDGAPGEAAHEPEPEAADNHALGDGDDFAIDVAPAAPILDPPRASPRRRPRAQTEALSDQDLEDMMESVSAGAELDDFDGKQTAQFLPVERADLDEPTEIVTAPEGDDVQPPFASILAAESAATADRAVAEPADAADSGELLTDDAVEEVSDLDDAVEEVSDLDDDVEEVSDLEDADDAVEKAEDEPAAADSAHPAPPMPPSPRPAPPRAQVHGSPPPALARASRPWFEEVFDEDYLRTLPFLTPQSTQFEANYVLESLGLSPGQQVLDVGCGYGRHAMELAARGVHVVGLDSSLPLLLRGADEAQRRGLSINFVHGDMRELAFDAQFDGAYCLFSTFGYFDDEVNKKTAQNIARALKPGGRMVIEVLNRDYLIDDLPARVWWEGDGCVVLEEVDFNYFSSRIVSNRSVVFDDGRQLEQEISLRAYSLHELGKLLHAAGFRVLEISGSMTTRGRFFGAKARDIVVVAERPDDTSG